MRALEVPVLSIRLKRINRDTWAIIAVDSQAVIATRRWAHAYQAVNWCRAVMSSYNQNYDLEIAEDE